MMLLTVVTEVTPRDIRNREYDANWPQVGRPQASSLTRPGRCSRMWEIFSGELLVLDQVHQQMQSDRHAPILAASSVLLRVGLVRMLAAMGFEVVGRVLAVLRFLRSH